LMKMAGWLDSATLLERLDRPSVRLFETAYLRRSQPVVITSAISGWKALTAWTPDCFKQRAADTIATVVRSPTREIKHHRVRDDKIAMKLGDYVDAIEGDAPSGGYFGCRVEIAAAARTGSGIRRSPLFDDIGLPMYIRRGTFAGANMWYAKAGIITFL